MAGVKIGRIARGSRAISCRPTNELDAIVQIVELVIAWSMLWTRIQNGSTRGGGGVHSHVPPALRTPPIRKRGLHRAARRYMPEAAEVASFSSVTMPILRSSPTPPLAMSRIWTTPS